MFATQPRTDESTPPLQASTGVSKKTKAAITAWGLLGIESVIMLYLFLSGEGRVARLRDTDNNQELECYEAEGPPTVALVFAARVAAAVLSQCYIFCCPNPTGKNELHEPEKAVFIVLGTCFWACGSGEEMDTNSGECFLDLFLGFLMAMYTAFPAYVDAKAVCEMATDNTILYAILCCGVFLACTCVRLTGQISQEMDHCCIQGLARVIRKKNEHEEDGFVLALRWLVIADAIVTGVFSFWGNFVQSGLIASAFFLEPSFEIVYTFYEIWFG